MFRCYKDSGGWKIDLAKGLRTSSWLGWGIYTPSIETAKINGESMFIERHTKSGQLGVEQWSGVSASPLLQSSQHGSSAFSRNAAEKDSDRPVKVRAAVIKRIAEVTLKRFIRIFLVYWFPHKMSMCEENFLIFSWYELPHAFGLAILRHWKRGVLAECLDLVTTPGVNRF